MAISSGRTLLDPEALLQKARLGPAMHYADFGAGMLGHFVFPAARIVGPATRVYAVDILKPALEAIQSRAGIEHASNVETVWGDIEVIGGVAIPAGTLDLISLVSLANLLVTSPQILAEAKRLLQPDGKLLIIGWKPESANPIAPPKDRRVSLERVQSLVQAQGMVVMETFDAGPAHWGMLVRMRPFKDYPIKVIG